MNTPPTPLGLLEHMTIEQVRNFAADTAIVPLGSTEPHGPHLPYGTDTLIVDSVSRQAVLDANAQGGRILRLPPLPIGNNVNFKGFPFACRISVPTLTAILLDVANFLREEGVRKIIIVNSHGGNDDAIKASLRQIYDLHQGELFVCSSGVCDFAGHEFGQHFSDGSPHAGAFETSMIQHIAPDLVVTSALEPTAMQAPEIKAFQQRTPHWVKPWHRFMPESYGGRPDEASAEKGRLFSAAAVKGLAAFLLEFSRAEWHPGFPYRKSES